MTGPGPEGAPQFRVGPDADPDRYVLGPAVASGAEGILYRGSITTAAGVRLEVAIKMLQPRFLTRVEDWHTRWMEQVELLRSLQVPGVVTVRDGFLGPLPHPPGTLGEGRTLYLVMNWVDGESLDEWVRHRPDRDPIDDLKVLVPVAAALDLMHSGRATGSVPVVHRDVKPSNILVTEHGSVLVDFGLTRGLPDGQRLSGVVGTPGYLAPESADDGSYSPASDRYGFGAVASFVLTGFEPPPGHQPEVLRALLAAVPALADQPDVVDHVAAMLATDPDARPPGLANWIGQLRRSSLDAGPDILNPPAPRRHPGVPGRRARPRRERRASPRRTAIVVAGAVIVVLAGLALLTADLLSGATPRHTPVASPLAFDPTCGQGQPVPYSFPGPGPNTLLTGAIGIGSAGTIVGTDTYSSYGSPQGVPLSGVVAIDPNCSVSQTFFQAFNLPFTLSGFSLTALTFGPNGSIYIAGSDGAGWVVARTLRTGGIDPTFGTAGLVIHPEAGADAQTHGSPTSIIATRSGDIFVFGHDGGAHCCAASLLVALRPDGSLDSAFGTHGIIKTDILPGSYSQLMAQTGDGSLLVGDSYANMGCGLFAIDKYGSTGKREPSFKQISATGTGTPCPGGGILIPGYMSTQLAALVPVSRNRFAAVGYEAPSTQQNLQNSPVPAFLIRFNPNGSIDRNFGRKGIVQLPGTVEPAEFDLPSLGAVDQPGGGVVVAMVRSTGLYLIYVTSGGRVEAQVRVPTPSSSSLTIAVGDAGEGKIFIVSEASGQLSVARYLGAGS